MAPPLKIIDHVHVRVRDRAAAARWYRKVLGLTPVPALEAWQADESHRVHIALGVDADGFAAWRAHLAQALGRAPEVVDHELSLSLYFRDPDGNPYEITTCEVATARAGLSTSA